MKFAANRMGQWKKERRAEAEVAAVRLTLRVKGQNVIDSVATGFDKASQSFRSKKIAFDKMILGKTENDRQIES